MASSGKYATDQTVFQGCQDITAYMLHHPELPNSLAGYMRWPLGGLLTAHKQWSLHYMTYSFWIVLNGLNALVISPSIFHFLYLESSVWTFLISKADTSFHYSRGKIYTFALNLNTHTHTLIRIFYHLYEIDKQKLWIHCYASHYDPRGKLSIFYPEFSLLTPPHAGKELLSAPREVEESNEFFAMPPTEKQLLAPCPLNLRWSDGWRVVLQVMLWDSEVSLQKHPSLAQPLGI